MGPCACVYAPWVLVRWAAALCAPMDVSLGVSLCRKLCRWPWECSEHTDESSCGDELPCPSTCTNDASPWVLL